MTKKIRPNTRRIEKTTDHWKVAASSTFIFESLSNKAKIRLLKRAPNPIPAVTVAKPNIRSSLKVIPIKWRFSRPNIPYTPSSLERFFMTKLLA